MPLKKNFPRIAILFTLLIVSLILVKVLPSFKLKAQAPLAPPVLVDFLLSTTEVDTDESADQVTLYARITSGNEEHEANVMAGIAPLAGCTEGDCWQPQAQNGYLYIMTEGCDSLGESFNVEGLGGTCGDALDGVYSITFDLPQYSALGDWVLYEMPMGTYGGSSMINATVSLSTFKITTESGERNIKFTNVGSEEDTEAPTIVDFDLDRVTIDTTDGDESLTMYMRISDDLSGVSDEYPPVLTFIPDNDPGYPMTEAVQFEFSLKDSPEVGNCVLEEGISLDLEGLDGCGDYMDGIYVATATVPQYSTGGDWRVKGQDYYPEDGGIYNLNDLIGNTTYSLAASFENESTVYDTLAPELTGLSITPSVFDTADSSQIVRFELDIEDDMAGLAEVSVGLTPVGTTDGYWGTWETGDDIEEGTIVDGTFVIEIEIPQDAPLGFYAVNNIDVKDVLNRSQRYPTGNLGLAFPDVPLYLVNQGTGNQVVLENAWTLENWPYYQEGQIVWPDISVRFQAGTVITKQEGGVFAFHRMLATKYNLESAASLSNVLNSVNQENKENLLECDAAEGCVETTVNTNSLVGTPLNIIKMGIPGLNLSFSKPVTIIIGVDSKYLGSTFVIQTFDTERNIWVNHGTCTVAMIIPESTEHGGDIYGITKPVAYSGCSFTTDHASFFSMNVLGETTVTPPPGVPNTGIGGVYNYFTRWIR
jgi:hypothetical protein